jgi:hypothetical protein
MGRTSELKRKKAAIALEQLETQRGAQAQAQLPAEVAAPVGDVVGAAVAQVTGHLSVNEVHQIPRVWDERLRHTGPWYDARRLVGALGLQWDPVRKTPHLQDVAMQHMAEAAREQMLLKGADGRSRATTVFSLDGLLMIVGMARPFARGRSADEAKRIFDLCFDVAKAVEGTRAPPRGVEEALVGEIEVTSAGKTGPKEWAKIRFTASVTSAPPGTTYAWDYGDGFGRHPTSSSPTGDATYTHAGTYVVRLEVRGNRGSKKWEASRQVDVVVESRKGQPRGSCQLLLTHLSSLRPPNSPSLVAVVESLRRGMARMKPRSQRRASSGGSQSGCGKPL